MDTTTTQTEDLRLADENQRLAEENAALRAEVEHLKNEMMRLISHNLDLTERLESNMELRRRVEVARELMEGNLERQRNADLQDDAQLLALLELRVEQECLHLKPNFDVHELGHLLNVSHERLTRLFRQRTIYRTPEAYVDNLRILAALRLLYSHPNYTIVTVAREAGFNNVRTMQRRVLEVTGMTPTEFRDIMTK